MREERRERTCEEGGGGRNCQRRYSEVTPASRRDDMCGGREELLETIARGNLTLQEREEKTCKEGGINCQRR